jgi:hypothetical protein
LTRKSLRIVHLILPSSGNILIGLNGVRFVERGIEHEIENNAPGLMILIVAHHSAAKNVLNAVQLLDNTHTIHGLPGAPVAATRGAHVIFLLVMQHAVALAAVLSPQIIGIQIVPSLGHGSTLIGAHGAQHAAPVLGSGSLFNAHPIHAVMQIWSSHAIFVVPRQDHGPHGVLPRLARWSMESALKPNSVSA